MAAFGRGRHASAETYDVSPIDDVALDRYVIRKAPDHGLRGDVTDRYAHRDRSSRFMFDRDDTPRFYGVSTADVDDAPAAIIELYRPHGVAALGVHEDIARSREAHAVRASVYEAAVDRFFHEHADAAERAALVGDRDGHGGLGFAVRDGGSHRYAGEDPRVTVRPAEGDGDG